MTAPLSLEFAGGSWSYFLVAGLIAAFLWNARSSPANAVLLTLRALAIVCVAAALTRPTVVFREALWRKPRLLIAVDAAHSMSAGAAGISRLEAAAAWLQKNRRSIEARAEVSLFAVSGSARRLSGWPELAGLKASQGVFEPAQALQEVALEAAAWGAPARVWLFSDGKAEASAGWETAVTALKAPVDVIGVDFGPRGKTLSFLEIKTPDFAFLHGAFEVRAIVEATAMAKENLRLRLLREDQKGVWETVSVNRLSVSSDFETLTSTLTAVAQSLGAERYRLVAESTRAGSVRHAREFRVEVIRQKYRIMYLAGRPSAEYSFLREFLKADPNHELVSFVIMRNPESPAVVPDSELSLIPFPAEEIFVRNLRQFDLFILENFSYARFRLPLSYLTSLKSFVAQGGALLVIGGENAFGLGGYRNTPLEEMLPVTLARQAPDFVPGLFNVRPAAVAHPLVRLYDTAEASHAAWESLAPMDGWARFDSVRPGASVLAVHPVERTAAGEPLPVLAVRDYGRGKVMLVSSDSTWRWKLGGATRWQTASFYARFWTKAVRYLTGSLELSKVKFAPVPDRLPAQEPAAFSLRIFDEAFKPPERGLAEVSVLWTQPGGTTRELLPAETEPGLFTIELTGLKDGAHRLKALAKLRGRAWGEDEVRFDWKGASGEAPMDRRWLERAAQAGGGEMKDLNAADASALLGKLPPQHLESEVSRRAYPWASPFWLWMTMALFILEWGLRRWQGQP